MTSSNSLTKLKVESILPSLERWQLDTRPDIDNAKIKVRPQATHDAFSLPGKNSIGGDSLGESKTTSVMTIIEPLSSIAAAVSRPPKSRIAFQPDKFRKRGFPLFLFHSTKARRVSPSGSLGWTW